MSLNALIVARLGQQEFDILVLRSQVEELRTQNLKLQVEIQELRKGEENEQSSQQGDLGRNAVKDHPYRERGQSEGEGSHLNGQRAGAVHHDDVARNGAKVPS